GDGEDVGGFELAVGVVAEDLLDAGDGDLVVQGDGHLVREHGQGRQLLLGGDEQAGGAAGGGGGQRQQERWQTAAHGKPLSIIDITRSHSQDDAGAETDCQRLRAPASDFGEDGAPLPRPPPSVRIEEVRRTSMGAVTPAYLAERLELADQLRAGRTSMLEPQDLP